MGIVTLPIIRNPICSEIGLVERRCRSAHAIIVRPHIVGAQGKLQSSALAGTEARIGLILFASRSQRAVP